MSNTADTAKQLFLEALERPANKRAAYIAKVCGDDTAIRDRVEALLDSHQRADRFLETPAFNESAASDHPSLAPIAPGTRIGHYQLGEVIGRGGMGIVYLAEQDSPRRQVALKILRAEMASPGLLQRFKLEADVLGRLQHPGIAQVLEANTTGTESGIRPYFAMELIRGRPLTEYAETARLPLPKRLDLLAKVCDAVHHAHQKGVIHRDLKPGNILVDESGQPKILDFGVARLTNSDLQITTLRTDIGQLIGTVPYMSPEQVAGDPREVDTRSDVYALGVVAYELLTGRLPYEMKGKSIPEAVRIIQDTDPDRPSSISRTLRGDVETIVLKALEKDKAQRYQSAAELGADLRRYLCDEPIQARPHSTLYQIRKFARRNKTLMAGVSVAAIGLMAGATFATLKAVEATHDRNLAVDAELRASQLASVAKHETRKAERINDFLRSILASANVKIVGKDATVGELLDRAALRIKAELGDEPEVEAHARIAIGGGYWSMGRLDDAELHLREAWQILRPLLGDGHPDETVALVDLAMLLRFRGRFAEAETLLRDALSRYQDLFGQEHTGIAAVLDGLAMVLYSKGRGQASVPLLRRALAMRRRLLGPDHPDVAATMEHLADALWAVGDVAANFEMRREALEMRRRIFGDEHISVAETMYYLASYLAKRHAAGDLQEAESLLRQRLTILHELIGDENLDVAVTLGVLAGVLYRERRDAEADRLFEQALAMKRRVLGNEHPEVARTLSGQGFIHHRRGALDRAEPAYRESLAIRRKTLGIAHPDTIESLRGLARVWAAQGDFDQAEQLYRELLASQRAALPDIDLGAADALCWLGELLLEQGRIAEAESLLRNSLDLSVRLKPDDEQRNVMARRGLALGRCLTALGRYDEAEPLLLESVDTLMAAPAGGLQARKREWINHIVELYDGWNRPEEAAEWRAKLSAAENSGRDGDE